MVEELLKDPRALSVGGLLLIAVVALWRRLDAAHATIISEKNKQIAELQEAKTVAREQAREAQEEMVALLKRQIEVTDASLRVAEQVRLTAAHRRDRREEDKT